MKSTKRSVIGGLTRSLRRREARPFDAQPFLLFCRRDSGPRVQVQAQLHSPVAQGSNLIQGGILENRITFFRGILYHCARDVIFFLFPRRALVRSRLVRELLRLARGHLQAGGQRPLTLPRGNRRGAGAHFLFLRLILLKQILDKEIKKPPSFLQAQHAWLVTRRYGDVHLPPDLPKCMEREAFDEKQMFILKHPFFSVSLLLFLCRFLLLTADSEETLIGNPYKSKHVEDVRGIGHPELHSYMPLF